MFKLATQPQTIGKLLDSSFKLYVGGLKGVLPMSFATAIVGQLPTFMGWTNATGGINPETLGIGMLVWVVIYMVLSLSVMGGIIYKYGAYATNNNASVGESWKYGLRASGKLLGSGILYGLVILLGMILLIVPGIYLSLSLAFYAVAIVLDDENVVDALKKSHYLVKGNWWRTMVVFTVPMVIMMVLYMIIGVFFGASMIMSADSIGPGVTDPSAIETALDGTVVVAAALEAVILGLVSPLFYAVMIVVYGDLRMRKEGGDIEAQLEG